MKAICVLLAVLSSLPAAGGAKDYKLEVTAGDREYRHAIVSLMAPEDFPKAGRLSTEGGATTAFQKSPDGELVFILSSLQRGTRALFSVAAEDGLAPSAKASERDGKITLAVNGKNVLVYQGAESELPRPDIDPVYKRGGYIHPVFSPSGRQVTDDYPANHVHHHGIWAPWTKTVFEGRSPDFWNMGQKKGKVEFAGFDRHWSGPVHAGFAARHRFVDLTAPEPKTALNESWNVTSYAVPAANFFIFDLVLTQKCATASPLILPKYFYGGMGVRGHWDWNGANKCFFLTSNGETDRVKANETNGRWCHMSGEVDGLRTGLAILGHPDNFRAPQGMRVHPDEPFFCYAPSQGGDWAIDPGKPYIARYRFIVRDGAPSKPELDRQWEQYAHPPAVRIIAAND